ncbi:NAD-dependent epimerase/dehydratase family protein [Nakamurella silvestris]|nr:NAD-dependent epimerase/dehydratase family protein [Nakamurella silvestris]
MTLPQNRVSGPTTDHVTVAVTGAAGSLGGRVIHHLLSRGLSPAHVVAVVRDRSRAGSLIDLGVTVREADYENTAAYSEALAGVDRVLLISSNAIGGRLQQHRNVVDAAVVAGVKLLAYSSIAHRDSSAATVPPEHRATEQYIRDSWMPFVFLRNGWYLGDRSETVAGADASGQVRDGAGEGRVPAVSREEFAAAAATVLTSDDQDNRIYEWGGESAAPTQPLVPAHAVRSRARS